MCRGWEEVRSGWFGRSTEDDGSVREGCHWSSVTELGMRLGDWVCWNRQRRSVGSLPGFRVGGACGLIGCSLLELGAISFFFFFARLMCAQ